MSNEVFEKTSSEFLRLKIRGVCFITSCCSSSRLVLYDRKIIGKTSEECSDFVETLPLSLKRFTVNFNCVQVTNHVESRCCESVCILS